MNVVSLRGEDVIEIGRIGARWTRWRSCHGVVTVVDVVSSERIVIDALGWTRQGLFPRRWWFLEGVAYSGRALA